MKKAILLCVGFWILISILGCITARESDYLSPLAVIAGKQGETLYVAEFTAKQVAEFDIREGKVTKIFSMPDRPSGLVISPDGSSLYVTGAAPEGRIHIVNLKNGSISYSLPTGHTPCAPLVSPDGGTLYVCNRFNNNVAVIDIKARRELAKIPVPREPIATALSPDGRLLFVANLLPAGAADKEYVAACVSIINTFVYKVTTDVQLPNGSTGLRGICVSPDGKYAYVSHILAHYQLPTTQVERGWMNTNALSIIDAEKQVLVNTVLLDNNDLGAGNPWGVACTEDGKYVCVTHAGTHELSVIDRAGLHEKLKKVATGERMWNSRVPVTLYPTDVPNDLSFMVGIRRRLKLEGRGPRGLTIVGTKVYVVEYFTDNLSVVDINSNSKPDVRSLSLGPDKPMTAVRRGEILFNDASMCFQHWQSCASCHPGARHDALNWDLMNDGIGNPKNTKSLLLSHKTPPAMMTGVRDRAETAVRAGIKNIQFVIRSERDAVAIDKYLKSLKPIPSPYLVKGKLTQAARRGEKIFKNAKCASCHSGSFYTDLKKYNVGVGSGREKSLKFDTPTLIELWRTAPYLYDGRALTINQVLMECNKNDQHGVTSSLTEKEINDLVEFILSL